MVVDFDGGVIASVLLSAAVAGLAFIVKIAARETLSGLKQSIDNHARAIDVLAAEVKEMRVEVSDLKQRMVRVETRQAG